MAKTSTFRAAIIAINDAKLASAYGTPEEGGAPRYLYTGGIFKTADYGPLMNQIGQVRQAYQALEAEQYAVQVQMQNASKEELEGGVMYLVGVEPDGTYTPNADCCSMCKRVIINAGIRYVVIATENGHKRIDVANWVNEDDSLTLHEGY